MRLTSELVLQSPSLLNCLGDRTLLLRNLSIPAIENLAVARDSYDTVDLSCNLIQVLGDGFPPFPRLSSLFLGANRITNIASGLADSLPNLAALILSANRIATFQDLNLKELARLQNLEVLCLWGNPVVDLPSAREQIVAALPSLKFLDFVKVPRRNAQDRGSCKKTKRKRVVSQNEGPVAKRQAALVGYDMGLGQGVADRMNDKKTHKPLAKDLSRKLKEIIAEATSIDEVSRIQKAVREGTINELLQEIANGEEIEKKSPS